MIVRRTSHSHRLLLFFAIAPILCVTSALGQATTGSISGRVGDAAGAAIPGAKVSIRNVEDGFLTVANTDRSGEFSKTALPPDHYTITVEMAGFSTANVPSFKLDIDQKARFEIPKKVVPS